MAIGTLFTFSVTPAVYTFLARDHAPLIARKRRSGISRRGRWRGV
jgi:hypothetical protein